MQIPEHWHIGEIGAGKVQKVQQEGDLQLIAPRSSADTYHDAQISDYSPQKPIFRNQPPLTMTIIARTEGDIQGTAGFGFWNHMFTPGERGFRVPQALWFFFGSEQNNIALAKGVAGHGWKAATFNAQCWQFFALLPLAPIGFPLMRNKTLYNNLWHIGQNAIGVSETALDIGLLKEFHTYTIDWKPDSATFLVDDKVILYTDSVPNKPLGFIAWVDNQYAIVTPQGNFGWGLLDVPQTQSLILRHIEIESDS